MTQEEALTHEIEGWLGGTDTPTLLRVQQLLRLHPCFMLPLALLLRRAGGDLPAETRRHLAARLAVAAPDLRQTALAADSDLADSFAGFYPRTVAEKPSTESAIDKFLDTYGTDDPHQEELLTRLIFNPTPDYAQILSREEEQSVPQSHEAPAGSQDDLINSFIIKSKAQGGQFPSSRPEEPAPAPAEKPAPVEKPAATDESLLSESLAQIYIRRGNFTKAYEIISQLNLKFPEKSIYFADQLRFLRKLMFLQGLNYD